MFLIYNTIRAVYVDYCFIAATGMRSQRMTHRDAGRAGHVVHVVARSRRSVSLRRQRKIIP
jgi:hypothetical protein